MGHIWVIYEYIWVVYESYMGHIWVIYVSYMSHTCVICVTYVWIAGRYRNRCMWRIGVDDRASFQG